jgi:hypothetical protein
LNLDKCIFQENNALILIEAQYYSVLNATETKFLNNNSTIFLGFCDDDKDCAFTECTFENNDGSYRYPYSFHLSADDDNPAFVDCTLGDSTFNDKSYAEIVTSKNKNPGSIFGEGSFSMIVSLAAIVLSAVSIGMVISSKKQKSVSVPEIDEE